MRRTGLARPLRWFRDRIVPSARRRRLRERRAFRRVEAQVGRALTASLHGDEPRGTVLVVGRPSVPLVVQESVVLKGFEAAGYRPTVVGVEPGWVRRAYELLGVDRFLRWTDCREPVSSRELRSLLDGREEPAELVEAEWEGVQLGKYALSTRMRDLRRGLSGLRGDDPDELRRRIRDSAEFARGAFRLLEEVRPEAAVFVDRGYTPSGELFDACVEREVPCFTWNAAHRENALLLKRYDRGNRNRHPSSLSADSWARLRADPARETLEEEARGEILGCYESGEWFGEVGTQHGTRLLDADEVRDRLGLGDDRPTAVVFPHIFWDATFFWGEDLFADYEAWLAEVLEAAVENDALDWVVKIHPANVVKDRRDGRPGPSAEERLVRERHAPLPDHVRLLPPETGISTASLFGVMDYCLTVRGTVGLESAAFGVRTLTAGTGRYDRRGFTMDFEDPDKYRDALRRLEEIPPMTGEEIDRALRYAYGVFLCRPLELEAVRSGYRHDEEASLDVGFRVTSAEELRSSPDVQRLSAWIGSGEYDYLRCP